jgi:hypothetical protein
VKEIEAENTTVTEENQTYAKQQLGVKQGETKLLQDSLGTKFKITFK